MFNARSLKTLSVTVALSVGLTASAAWASPPDLTPQISQASVPNVYAMSRYTLRVRNLGTQKSQTGTVTVTLPATHTSPQVYLLGTAGVVHPSCARSGRVITCPFPRINGGQSATFDFDYAAPQNAGPVNIAASITVNAPDNGANNNITYAAQLNNPDYLISSDADVTNDHCTGTGLTSYFECTLFPSSISQHDVVFDYASHTISIPAAGPTYGGTWSQPTDDSLVFQYTESGNPVANFTGFSVGNNCFEGLTTFLPPSQYVSPYHVCIIPRP